MGWTHTEEVHGGHGGDPRLEQRKNWAAAETMWWTVHNLHSLSLCATERGKAEPEKDGVVWGVLSIYFTSHYPGSFNNKFNHYSKFKSVWPATVFGDWSLPVLTFLYTALTAFSRFCLVAEGVTEKLWCVPGTQPGWTHYNHLQKPKHFNNWIWLCWQDAVLYYSLIKPQQHHKKHTSISVII